MVRNESSLANKISDDFTKMMFEATTIGKTADS